MHVDPALREFAGDSHAQAAAQDRVLAAQAEREPVQRRGKLNI